MSTSQLTQSQITNDLDKKLYQSNIKYDSLGSRWMLFFVVDSDLTYPMVFPARQRGGLRHFQTSDAALKFAHSCGYSKVLIDTTEL